MDHPADSSSRVTRFLLRGEFDFEKRTAHKVAFEPDPNPAVPDPRNPEGQLELSVSDSDNIGRVELVADGNFVAIQRGDPTHPRTLRGWVHIGKSVLRTLGLRDVPDRLEGFERHTEIIDWPLNDEDRELIYAALRRATHGHVVLTEDATP